MGDFAAGKLGGYSGPTGAASVEDVAQAIVDLEGLFESKVLPHIQTAATATRRPTCLPPVALQAKDLSQTIAAIAPASDSDIAATGAPADLAAALKKRDGGHYVFDYRLYSCAEIIAATQVRPAPLE